MSSASRTLFGIVALLLVGGITFLMLDSQGEQTIEDQPSRVGENAEAAPEESPALPEETPNPIHSVPFTPEREPAPSDSVGRRNATEDTWIELEGWVIVTDPQGWENRELKGDLRVAVVTDSSPRPDPPKVEVDQGRFHMSVPSRARLRIVDARLGGRRVEFAETERMVPPDGRLVLRGWWPLAARLRVRDARTGIELAGVTVRAANRWLQRNRSHPGVPPGGRVLAEDAASPVPIPEPQTQVLWVGARGYAWTQIKLPPGLEELTAELEPGGDLRVLITGAEPPEGFVLRLYSGAASGIPDCECAAGGRGELQIEGLAPGRWQVALQKGDWFHKPLELARSGAEVSVGTMATLRLEARSAEQPETVTVTGQLRLAEAWGREDLAIAFQPLESARAWAKREIRIQRGGLTRMSGAPAVFAWSTAELIPGPWQVIVHPMDHRTRIDVPAGGLANVTLEIPAVADVQVTLRDAETSTPLKTKGLTWHGKLPKGVGGWSSRQAKLDAKTGVFHFRAPAGPVSISAHPEGYEWLNHDAELHPGRNDIDLPVHRSCGIQLVVRANGVTLPFDHGWNVRPREIDGPGRGRTYMSTGRISVSRPGRYAITMNTLAGFQPPKPTEITIPRGKFVTVTVELAPIR